MKIALVHDWLTGMRGGEYVLEAIAECFPKAVLHTLIYVPASVSPTLIAMQRRTSVLQKIPGIEKRYRHFLPLFPRVIESFDMSEFDLIISSSHCVAKGVRKRKDAVHLAYVHAPMRYVWDRFEDYFGVGRASAITRLGARLFRKKLQAWDRGSSSPARIDGIIANSRYIASQIKSHWGRESDVIHPFADLDRFRAPRAPSRTYLMVGAFAPYKRVDLAVKVFNELQLPLLIVGSGQDEARLKKLAGPTVDFVGSLSNQSIEDLFSKCRALVFPGIEDFGITPVEAMAAGAPVIAFREGGATETVTEKTGVFFDRQDVESLKEAVLKMERGQVQFSDSDCRQRAAHFSKERFQKELLQVVGRWVKLE